MSKLYIKEELFKPIKNVEKIEIKRDKNHQELVKDANLKIQESYYKKQKAYEDSKNYLNS